MEIVTKGTSLPTLYREDLVPPSIKSSLHDVGKVRWTSTKSSSNKVGIVRYTSANLPKLHAQCNYYVPHVSLMCGFISTFKFTYVHMSLKWSYFPSLAQLKNQWKRFLSLTVSWENITIAPSTLNVPGSVKTLCVCIQILTYF